MKKRTLIITLEVETEMTAKAIKDWAMLNNGRFECDVSDHAGYGKFLCKQVQVAVVDATKGKPKRTARRK